MAIRLAVDFGTATTCMATVADGDAFIARTIPIEDNAAIVSTAAFLDQPSGGKPLVVSQSEFGRHPMSVFKSAIDQFDLYWQGRRHARGCGVRWSEWENGNREEALLLTYFKPELADFPVRVPLRVPRIRWGGYDPISQSDHFDIEFDERSIATPDPDTNDLIAATAAVLRECVRRALQREQAGERISILTIGLPSFADDVSSDEARRAQERRLEAVKLARIREDFGTSDFRVEMYGEAEAAAWSYDIDMDRPTVYKIIVDVGAGTTDLALVEYIRGERGRYRVGQRIKSASLRYAGRDLNLALAMVLGKNREFHEGIGALDKVDRRAWQYVMDRQVEAIKCDLDVCRKTFQVNFNRVSAFEDATEDMRRISHTLRKSAFVELSANDSRLRGAVGGAVAKAWLPTVSQFIHDSLAQLGDRRNFAGVEKVGGAFRFAPLTEQFLIALRENGLPPTQVKFRDEGGAAQTMVARGLARWTALL